MDSKLHQTLQGLCLIHGDALPNRSSPRLKFFSTDLTCPRSEVHLPRTKEEGLLVDSKIGQHNQNQNHILAVQNTGNRKILLLPKAKHTKRQENEDQKPIKKEGRQAHTKEPRIPSIECLNKVLDPDYTLELVLQAAILLPTHFGGAKISLNSLILFALAWMNKT